MMRITNHWIIFFSSVVQTFAFRKNIAFKKDTIQSSTLGLTSGQPAYSFLVNDGNREQIGVNDGVNCGHTEHDETDYWWAVDLGQEYTINIITIYNRVDCCGYRLSDFEIFIYNPSISTWTNFDQEQEHLCFFHDGTAPSVLSIACNRNIRGRYIKIYKKYNFYPDRDALTLCEVEVFADQTPNKGLFCKQINKQPILSLQMSLRNATSVRCASSCRHIDRCLGFTMVLDGTCSLFQTSRYLTGGIGGSKYYERC